MALAAVVTETDHEVRTKEIVLAVTPSGNYVTGGDTLNLTAATNPQFKTDAKFGFPGKIEQWEVLSCPAGYQAVLVPGSTLANWLLQYYQGGAAVSVPGAQIPAAAYPGALTATPTYVRFKGPKLRM